MEPFINYSKILGKEFCNDGWKIEEILQRVGGRKYILIFEVVRIGDVTINSKGMSSGC
jgi:hypothetical protein